MKSNWVSVTIFGLIAIIMCACKSNIAPVAETNHSNHKIELYLDVINDNRLDTLIIESLSGKSNQKKIRLLKGKDLEDIFIVELSGVRTEDIYIESNSRSDSEKGFRMILRNTNMIPDYNYLDLLYENKAWLIKNIGYINTNPDGDLESCIAPYDQSIYEVQLEKNIKLLDIKKIVFRSDAEKFECK